MIDCERRGGKEKGKIYRKEYIKERGKIEGERVGVRKERDKKK